MSKRVMIDRGPTVAGQCPECGGLPPGACAPLVRLRPVEYEDGKWECRLCGTRWHFEEVPDEQASGDCSEGN